MTKQLPKEPFIIFSEKNQEIIHKTFNITYLSQVTTFSVTKIIIGRALPLNDK